MSYSRRMNTYSYNNVEYELDQLEQNTRNRVFIFEASPLKNNEKFNKTLSELEENKDQLSKFHHRIRGFNPWAALLFTAGTHYGMLIQQKRLLYEIKSPAVLYHLGISLGAGLLGGLVVGNATSYSWNLYRKYSRVNSSLNKLIDDFVHNYNPQTQIKPAVSN